MWLLGELAVWVVADIFGYKVGKNQPWWVEPVASFGCTLFILAIIVGLFFLLSRIV